MTTALFHVDDPGDFRRLRDALDAHGYDDAGIAGVLGESLPAVAGKKVPPLLRRTAGDSPLEILIRLFVLGVPVEERRAGPALAPMGPAWWAERGLVRLQDGQVEATVQLRCYQGLVVAFDFHRRGGAALPPDYVMGISPSSLTLAGLTVRQPNRSALDVGTGSGFQALLAAGHSERVVATDRNPRAVQMAAFNAALNGLAHVECRAGDLFEPVGGEEFDLVVSNPPFIVSPDNLYLFLHSGRTGDEVCRTIARDAGRHLRPGGYCQFLANWTAVAGEDWRDRLAGWFAGTGCDAWVLKRSSTPPDEYAATWIETEEGDEGFARSFGAWMDYYERLGVESIDSGLITMRRSATVPWYRADDAPETMGFPAGADILRTFELQDFLTAHPDDGELLAGRFRLAPDVRLDYELRPGDGGWEAVTTRLRRTDGLRWSGGIDPYSAQILGGCDGTRTMGEVLSDLASSLGGRGDELEAHWPAIVRRLIEQGFLTPGPAPPPA